MSETNHQAVAVIERGETLPQVHPLAMVQQAVERGLDPDTISKLMDLADRHAATEARKAYTQAMVGLKRDLPVVLNRDKIVDFRTSKGPVHYTHTSLAAAVDAITEPLTQHGFSVAWSPTTEGTNVKVTCRLTHAQGHSEETTLTAPIDMSGSKSTAQGIASTITLLQRYSLLSMLGIATADMEEPKGETPPDLIDTERNMRAVKACVDIGKTKEDAERKVGKPVDQWTAADLDVLRAWVMHLKSVARAATGQQRPEHDFGPPPMTDEEAAEMEEATRGVPDPKVEKEEPGL